MDTLMQSQIFFFISSIGFIVLGVLATILMVYLIRISRAFSRIIEKVEQDVDAIGDTTKEMLEEVRDSTAYHFLFGHKRKSKRASSSARK